MSVRNDKLKIRSEVLAKVLRAHRERLHQSVDETDRRLKHARNWWAKQSKERQLTADLQKDIGKFEVAAPGDLMLDAVDLEIIAFAYRINRLILDSLSSSEAIQDVCVVLNSMEEYDEISDPPLAGVRSERAHYRLARRRLRDTHDLSIGDVVLDGSAGTGRMGGSSQRHQHVGDELSIVMDGEIETELVDSGLRVRLQKGDYLHFYAEQTHVTRNVGLDVAHCLVIRFHQTASVGVRYDLYDKFIMSRAELEKSARSESQAVEKSIDAKSTLSAEKKQIRTVSPDEGSRMFRRSHLTDLAYAEAMAAIMPFDLFASKAAAFDTTTAPFEEPVSCDLENDPEIVDRFGLGRVLQMACAPEYRGGNRLTLDQLEERAKERGYRFSRSKFDRLHNGLARIRLSDLAKLAPLYDLGRTLLINYAFPATSPAIAVSKDNGWEEVPNSYFGDPADANSQYKGVHYRVPKRRLAYSDIAIAELILEPSCSTPLHRHPGHELLLPLDAGKFQVELGGASVVVERQEDVRRGEYVYAHYDSTINHFVQNIGDENARALVIRFYSLRAGNL